MKKFAVLAMAAVTFLSTFDSSEAQVLRRFRNNVREAISPLSLPLQQVQPLDSAQPPLRIQRPAPQRLLSGSGPQQLTPFSRLPPQQRVPVTEQRVTIQQQRVVAVPQQRLVAVPQQRLVAVPQQRVVTVPQQRVVTVPQQRLVTVPQRRVSIPAPQLVNEPVFNAPAPVVSPAGGTKVRIVTYLDPRSGRTFQRRFLLPGNSPTGIAQGTRGQVVTGSRSIFTQPTSAVEDLAINQSVGPVPLATPSVEQSLVPPIEFSSQVTQQPANVSSGLLPSLAGPVLADPTTVAQPIAASIENFAGSSQIETASAEIETSQPESGLSSQGIPDLSGLTVDGADAATPAEPAVAVETVTIEPAEMDSAPMESALVSPADETDQDLFFDNESIEETTEASLDETADVSDTQMFEVSTEEPVDVDADELFDDGDAADYSVLEEE